MKSTFFFSALVGIAFSTTAYGQDSVFVPSQPFTYSQYGEAELSDLPYGVSEQPRALVAPLPSTSVVRRPAPVAASAPRPAPSQPAQPAPVVREWNVGVYR